MASKWPFYSVLAFTAIPFAYAPPDETPYPVPYELVFHDHERAPKYDSRAIVGYHGKEAGSVEQSHRLGRVVPSAPEAITPVVRKAVERLAQEHTASVSPPLTAGLFLYWRFDARGGGWRERDDSGVYPPLDPRPPSAVSTPSTATLLLLGLLGMFRVRCGV